MNRFPLLQRRNISQLPDSWNLGFFKALIKTSVKAGARISEYVLSTQFGKLIGPLARDTLICLSFAATWSNDTDMGSSSSHGSKMSFAMGMQSSITLTKASFILLANSCSVQLVLVLKMDRRSGQELLALTQNFFTSRHQSFVFCLLNA